MLPNVLSISTSFDFSCFFSIMRILKSFPYDTQISYTTYFRRNFLEKSDRLHDPFYPWILTPRLSRTLFRDISFCLHISRTRYLACHTHTYLVRDRKTRYSPSYSKTIRYSKYSDNISLYCFYRNFGVYLRQYPPSDRTRTRWFPLKLIKNRHPMTGFHSENRAKHQS